VSPVSLRDAFATVTQRAVGKKAEMLRAGLSRRSAIIAG